MSNLCLVLSPSCCSYCRGHWNCTGIAWELHWNCMGISLELPWNCTGVPLEFHWNCSGVSLEFHWNCTGVSLELHGNCIGIALELLWSFTGVALEILVSIPPQQMFHLQGHSLHGIFVLLEMLQSEISWASSPPSNSLSSRIKP